MRYATLALSSLTCAVALAAEPQSSTPPEGQTPVGAEVQLKPTQGNSVQGTLSLSTQKAGVRIGGIIEGLKPNAEHGFHVHEKGDCSAPDASSAGAHFNPSSQPHGNPNEKAPRHLGDMINLRADSKGVAKVDAFLDGATLHTSQPTDVLGKAIVVHEKPDDYTTQPSGNSGGRVACGVIR
jgi:Cu-Zn family superoxide dismutase